MIENQNFKISNDLKLKQKVVVIDYGMGNTWSVISAIKHVGINCELSNDKSKILEADCIVLPGVGSFKKGVMNLKKLDIFEFLKDQVSNENKKILGICLGFQLLGMSSTEEGFQEGLNLIPAKVEKFDCKKKRFKIPHIGFNSVNYDKNDYFFKNLNNKNDFYFVHSYRFIKKPLDGFISTCNYGQEFIATYHKENIFGTQFHPEKSQINGLILLKNFFEI